MTVPFDQCLPLENEDHKNVNKLFSSLNENMDDIFSMVPST